MIRWIVSLLIPLSAIIIVLQKIHAATRGSVAAFLRARDVWIESADIRRVFKWSVTASLYELVDAGLVERREGQIQERAQARGFRPVVSYRWKGP